MEKLIVGIDLCDTYTQAAVLGREEAWMLPTVICRKKSAEEWYVGEDAYKYTLVGEGVIVDKLLSLAAKEGTSTIGGVKSGGMELLQRFLGSILAMVRAEYAGQRIDELVISLKNLEMKLLEGLTSSVEALGIPRGNVHIASHTECFVYYVLNQRRDVWGGPVGMFSLSDEDLRYYELKVTRGPQRMTAIAEHEELEEGFSLSVLDTGSGAKMAKGAAMKAEDYLNESGSGSFVCLCEGKLKSTVSLEVMKRDTKTEISLASAGESWYEARSVVEVIPDGEKEICYTITPQQEPKKKRTVKIPLEGFPERPNKTTKIRVAVGFLDEKTLVVKLTDQGFGELFPKTDAVVRQEVTL